MDDIRKALATVAASLQVLGANTAANTRDLQRMSERSRQSEAEVQKLNGTFASIEQHLVKLFEHDAATQARLEKVEARLDALEQRQPPAA